MKYHRNHCFGPSWGSSFGWPYRHAYGLAFAQVSRTREEQPTENWYSHKEHRHRSHHVPGFGVRRPLRYLSYQLDLDERQRRQIGAVLDEVKIEREQAALDEKKMVADLADQINQPEIAADSLRETLSTRVRSTERVQKSIANALEKIVGALDADQREEFAYLLRTGTFRI